MDIHDRELITRLMVRACRAYDNCLSFCPKTGFRATTTNIYNDYIVNLARHAKGWRVCRGLNVPITL